MYYSYALDRKTFTLTGHKLSNTWLWKRTITNSKKFRCRQIVYHFGIDDVEGAMWIFYYRPESLLIRRDKNK